MEMYKKTEKKYNIWVIPLVAGFCAIIAILAPTAYFSYGGVTWNWWMWDFTTMSAIGYESVSLFISEVDFIIPAIITTFAVLLSAINLFIISNTTRKRYLNTKNFELMSLISAVMSIGIMIYYIIALDIAFYDGLIVEGTLFPAGFHFWDTFSPGFGIIMPFISAIIAFIGIGVFRYYSKRIDDIIPPKMGTVQEYIPMSKSMGSLNFCPECGYKLLQADANFCTNCGFKF
ncbi:MAG: zinc ribbon domain-containing protein [Candidatus Lokiarchaeota archaeon]|nr:zinc ribbon domain-containing protein [Candidatus Lokiarchaeota archaeon]